PSGSHLTLPPRSVHDAGARLLGVWCARGLNLTSMGSVARLVNRLAMSESTSGTVTFVFTDIEGSTELLTRLGVEGYAVLLADHHRLLREVFAGHRGEEINTLGDSFFVAFRSASDAVSAAVAIQRALGRHGWPDGAAVRVRIGIDSGEAAMAGEQYLGISVHRAARIGATGPGGQGLRSSSSCELVDADLTEGISLRDLGWVRLKDIERPERISQLLVEGLQLEFPALRGTLPGMPRHRLPSRRVRSILVLAGVLTAAAVAAIVVT